MEVIEFGRQISRVVRPKRSNRSLQAYSYGRHEKFAEREPLLSQASLI
jgi:hypothetical protein